MEYKVELYSKYYQILSGVTFDDKHQTALHILRIITNSKVPIQIAVEKIYSKEDNKKISLIIYRLYEYEVK